MEIYEQLILSLRQVNRAVDLHSKQLNKKFGLTGPQLLVIKKTSRIKGTNGKSGSESR